MSGKIGSPPALQRIIGGCYRLWQSQIYPQKTSVHMRRSDVADHAGTRGSSRKKILVSLLSCLQVSGCHWTLHIYAGMQN